MAGRGVDPAPAPASRTVPAVLALVAGLVVAAEAARAGGLSGPVFDRGARAQLVDVVQLPASSGSPPLARLNVLREVPDGSGRLFVNDLRGPLHVIDGGSVFLFFDLSALRSDLKTSPGLASGFVSFAFHPDYATNGLLYTVHSEFVGSTPATHGPAEPSAVAQHSVLTEWTVTDPSSNAFAGSSRELLRVEALSHHHNLGELVFDPTVGPGDPDYGLLYLAGGDYGSVHTGQPEQLQRLDTLHGALLRIDPTGGTGAPYSYGIPADNPYASDGDPDTFGEIYAHGFRNGHRLSWSQEGFGGPWVSELGQHNLEEVNLLVAGANYGWPEREGSYAIDVETDLETVFALPPNDASFGYTYPAAQYDHDEGRAIAGGFVDEADPTSRLHGAFLFGDIVSGRMFYAWAGGMVANASDGDPATTAPLLELGLVYQGSDTTLLDVVRDALGDPGTPRTDLRFAQDLSGDLYVTTKRDGWVRRLIPASSPGVPGLPGWWALVLAWALVVSTAPAQAALRAPVAGGSGRRMSPDR